MYHKGFCDVTRYLPFLEYFHTQRLTSNGFQTKFDSVTGQIVSSLKEFFRIKQFRFFQAFHSEYFEF